MRYCLLILANLAVSRTNHEELMEEPLITLAGFSKHHDIKCRQHAVFALGNLCANHDNLERIVKAGCVKTLITSVLHALFERQMSCIGLRELCVWTSEESTVCVLGRYAFPSTDSSTNVQFQAIAALRGLATHQTIRMQLVREGALEPLILASQLESVEVQREVAATLCNLALAEENKVQMARNGVLPALIALAQSKDREREIHSCACIANLAEMVEGRTQRRMLEEGCLRPLLNLASSTQPEVVREVARSLALFASKRDSQAAVLRSGGVQQMVAFARQDDAVSRRFGALAIGNLAVVTQNHQVRDRTGRSPRLAGPCWHALTLFRWGLVYTRSRARRNCLIQVRSPPCSHSRQARTSRRDAAWRSR